MTAESSGETPPISSEEPGQEKENIQEITETPTELTQEQTPAEETKKEETESEKTTEETRGKTQEGTQEQTPPKEIQAEVTKTKEELLVFNKEEGTLKTEREINKERVIKYLADRASEAIEKGFPFKKGDYKFNIDRLGEMDPIKYPRGRIENAKQFVKKKEEEWDKKTRELPEEERAIEEEKKRVGEDTELLITAILSKGLKKRFDVFISHKYDDYKHKVDNVIIDKETGKSVVAFDAKSGKPGPEFEQQKKEIEDLNQKGGTTLEFGVRLVPDKGKMKVIPGSTGNLPLFFLSLSAKDVREGMEQFKPSENEMSEKEIEIFNHLISLMAHHIDQKQPDRYKLSPIYIDALDSFDEGLKDLKLIKEKEIVRHGRRFSERRAIRIESGD